MAQLVARSHGVREAAGSSPVTPTNGKAGVAQRVIAAFSFMWQDENVGANKVSETGSRALETLVNL